MSSSTSVQAHATTRNALVELFVDLILKQFAESLSQNKQISKFSGPQIGVEVTNDDSRDIFDHKLVLFPNDSNEKVITIWGQTTCYKGHKVAIREPNKTYEIRETLIEALGLRRRLISEKETFFIIHITVGPSSYAYQWFEDAKAASFDLSIQILHPEDGPSLYEILEQLALNLTNDFDIQLAFAKAMIASEYLKSTVEKCLEALKKMFLSKGPRKNLADEQAHLLQTLREKRLPIAEAMIKSEMKGEGIKTRALKLLAGEESSDLILLKTVSRLTDRNPFISHALQVLTDWTSWINRLSPTALESNTIQEYLSALWALPAPNVLIVRRILIRSHSSGGSFYPADINVKGLTEHNLYARSHSQIQIEEVVEYLRERYSNLGITTAEGLFKLIGEIGVKSIRASLSLETVNGTNLKPSFYYVEEYLKPEFELKKFVDAGMTQAIGFHADFTSARVEAYENVKVVVDVATRKPIAILKGKFFRQQEFARRAKEEAYVGLTLSHRYRNNEFVAQFPGMPVVMFIDAAPDCRVPSYSVIKLITVGWDLFFSASNMKQFFLERADDR